MTHDARGDVESDDANDSEGVGVPCVGAKSSVLWYIMTSNGGV